jgi:RNA polymerase sigma-70 factor (ECF subfamily)
VVFKGFKLRVVPGGGAKLPLPPGPGEGDDLGSLARRCAEGDDRAATTLLTALGPVMLQVVRRVLGARHPDVEDTLQEAAVSLMRALPTFRGDSSTRHFARRIAARAAIDVRRRQGRVPVHVTGFDGDEDDRPADSADDARDPRRADWALVARRRELIRRLVDELPVPQAEALVLHCAAGMTVEEVARATGVPLETARSRLRLAKAALRERVERDPATFDLLEELP